MTSWHSYPKIYNIGHAYLNDMLTDPVLVEEKIDGSQFSFGKFDGKLMIRSKGVVMDIDSPEKMFNHAADTVKELAPLLNEGWTYRAEYLQKPKHNALAYDRIPTKHLMIFDINCAEEKYLDYVDKYAEATRLGLEVVPVVFEGVIKDAGMVLALMDRLSILGGQKMEGVVIKNYHRFGRDGKAMLGKYVSEAFKEVHRADWKDNNPTGKDMLTLLGEQYRTPARWNKAMQHLKERGELTNSPKDIGPLIREVQSDLLEECGEEIKAALFKWAKDHITRQAIRGLPEHYKQQLLELQFEQQGGES